jgi:hypothetical protein
VRIHGLLQIDQNGGLIEARCDASVQRGNLILVGCDGLLHTGNNLFLHLNI